MKLLGLDRRHRYGLDRFIKESVKKVVEGKAQDSIVVNMVPHDKTVIRVKLISERLGKRNKAVAALLPLLKFCLGRGHPQNRLLTSRALPSRGALCKIGSSVSVWPSW